MKNSKAKLYSTFKTYKPIIGTVHLKGNNSYDKLRIAIEEIDEMIINGVDAILVENYFGEESSIEKVLQHLRIFHSHIIYGVSISGDFGKSCSLAEQYGAGFIQIGSVAGHLAVKDHADALFGNRIKAFRQLYDNIFIFGGVRSKYQGYLSGRTLEEDLKVGMDRCDAIVATGDGTSRETDLDRLKEYRKLLGDFSLAVVAGLNAQNCHDQLSIADAGFVGRDFRHKYKDNRDASTEYTREFMAKIKTLR